MEAYIESIANIEYDNKYLTQINFCGCNFNCPWCNTPYLLNTKEEFLIDLKEVKKKINDLSSTSKGVLITGGEPCFQRAALIEIANFCKENKINIMLHTNASKPEVIEYLITNSLINNFIVDFKCPLNEEFFQKTTKSKTFFIETKDIINHFKKSMEILNSNKDKINVEIITTIIPGLLFRKEDLIEIGKKINDSFKWKIQKYKKTETLSKTFSNLNEPGEIFMKDLKEFLEKKFYLKTIILENDE
jgi:pyruvate formate lyase activating enzyme